MDVSDDCTVLNPIQHWFADKNGRLRSNLLPITPAPVDPEWSAILHHSFQRGRSGNGDNNTIDLEKTAKKYILRIESTKE